MFSGLVTEESEQIIVRGGYGIREPFKTYRNPINLSSFKYEALK